MNVADEELDLEFRKFTLERFVELRNNEDRLIGERFTALLFASSFLAVVWGTADSIGTWGRLAVAFVGLLVTVLIWRMNFRSAQAAEDWRVLAEKEELELYGKHPDDCKRSQGPYGLRLFLDDDRSKRWIEGLWGLLRWPGLGRTNSLSSFFVPMLFAIAWVFAIVYTPLHVFVPEPIPVKVTEIAQTEGGALTED